MADNNDLKTQERELRSRLLEWCKQYHLVVRQAASAEPETRQKALAQLKIRFTDTEREFLNNNVSQLIKVRSNLAEQSHSSIIANFVSANDLQSSDVTTGITEIKSHAPTLIESYARFKQRLLHKPVLSMGEFEAPMFNCGSQPFSWDETKAITKAVYRELGFEPSVSEMLEKRTKATLNGKVEADYGETQKGKAHILAQNLDGSLFDPRGIVHEAGHGIHSESWRGKKFYPPVLGETVTLFAEAMFLRKMLNDATPEQRIAVLSNQLDQDMAYLMQAAQIDFEQKAYRDYTTDGPHKKPLSLWLESMREFAGDSVSLEQHDVLPEAKMTMWNHFINEPGYAFGYLIGWAAAPQLVEKYEQDPEAFKQKFATLLEKGGDISAPDFLKEFGIDMRAPDFWEKRFTIMQQQLDELQSLHKQQLKAAHGNKGERVQEVEVRTAQPVVR